MSKYVNELIKDLSDNPTSFKDYNGSGVEKGNVIISSYGNTRMLSVINIRINGKRIPASYIDLWKMEVAISKWYKTVSLHTLIV